MAELFHPFTHGDVTRGCRQLLSLHPRPDATIESTRLEGLGEGEGQVVYLVSGRGGIKYGRGSHLLGGANATVLSYHPVTGTAGHQLTCPQARSGFPRARVEVRPIPRGERHLKWKQM